MDFLQLAKDRSSIRRFKDKPVKEEDLNKLLEAGRYAPSGGNCQPWHFYVIKSEKMKKTIYEEACNQDLLLTAPIFIIVCSDAKRSYQRYGSRGSDFYTPQDNGAAIQNILLCAQNLGLASCWVGSFHDGNLANLLKLEEGLKPMAILPIGYADEKPTKPSRRPIEEIVTYID